MTPGEFHLRAAQKWTRVGLTEQGYVELREESPDLTPLRVGLIRQDQTRRSRVVEDCRLKAQARIRRADGRLDSSARQIEQRAIGLHNLFIHQESFVCG